MVHVSKTQLSEALCPFVYADDFEGDCDLSILANHTLLWQLVTLLAKHRECNEKHVSVQIDIARIACQYNGISDAMRSGISNIERLQYIYTCKYPLFVEGNIYRKLLSHHISYSDNEKFIFYYY